VCARRRTHRVRTSSGTYGFMWSVLPRPPPPGIPSACTESDQPAALSPIQALRAAFRAVFAQLSPQQYAEQRQRVALILSVPELRAAMLNQFAQAIQLLADAVAERTGHRSADLAVHTLAGAVVGALMVVMFTIADDPTLDLVSLLDASMAHLEAGLPL
jgi:hypothetical protein